MSETDTPSPTAEGESAKKKGGFLVPLLTAVFAGAASFGAAFMLIDPPAPQTEIAVKTGATTSGQDSDIQVKPLDVTYVDLDPLTLSIQDNSRLLKIGLTLETHAGGDYIASDDPVLRDVFTSYLRALRSEHIQDVSYMNHIRAQLLRRAQIAKGEQVVHGILITDFLVQ